MAGLGKVKEQWLAVREKLRTPRQKMEGGLQSVGNVFKIIVSWVVRLHKVILAAPVVAGAGYLAQYNYDHLPSQVGIDLQATGQYAQLISKDAAVLAPLMVTGLCLLFMFCSRRTIYPWIISIFSLVLPVLILVTNIFPG